MRVAWCPQHRGVMRISFFDPPQPHFRSPCPRCQGVLVEQIRNKYALINPGAEGSNLDVPSSFPDEEVTPAPSTQLCQCCETMKIARDGFSLCLWCRDCPTECCDVPTRILKKVREQNG